MNPDTLIVGGHGLGDCLLSFQCAQLLKLKNIDCDIAISSRPVIISALRYLYDSNVILEIPESESANHDIEKGTAPIFNDISKDYKNIYYVIPDLLFNNSKAFDCRKFQTSPQIIRSLRTLIHKNKATKKIYVGLQTSTEGYDYKNIPDLLTTLAGMLPDYTIYFPNIKSWANGKTCYINNKDFPDNVFIDEEPTLNDSLHHLLQSCYFIGTDNGPSHIAYQLGIPRLILDPQFNKIIWVARWKEDNQESIPIHTSHEIVSKITYLNITCPQTSLIPRTVLYSNSHLNTQGWKQALLVKEL